MEIWWPVVVVAKSRSPRDVINGPALSRSQKWFVYSNGFRVSGRSVSIVVTIGIILIHNMFLCEKADALTAGDGDR